MNVLMIGAGRDVRGGVSSVVNNYYAAGLDNLCNLTYLPTMENGLKIKKLFVAAKARLKFETLIKQNDILHVHMSADNSFYRKAFFIKRAFKENKKIIIHVHGSTFDLFYQERCNDNQKRKVREVFAMADRVIALSEDWKEFLAEYVCPAEKIQVRYNAVKLPSSYEKDYTNRNILFLGVLGQRKGIYDLIEILPRVFQEFPDAHVYLGGDGEKEKVERLCIEKGITNKVSFLGWIRGKEKEKKMKECSIYVLPTYHEGMPMSVLEAMSYGMAVISTYVGGIPHIITNGENGLLYKAGEQMELKNALTNILSESNMRAILGKNAREKIEKDFNIELAIKDILNLYQELDRMSYS